MDNPEKASGTVGSVFKLLEAEKRNEEHRKDLDAVKKFINEQAGFRFSYGSSDAQSMTIKAFAK